MDEKERLVVTHLLWKLFHHDSDIAELKKSIRMRQDRAAELEHDNKITEEQWKTLKRELAKLQKQKLKLEKAISTASKELDGRVNISFALCWPLILTRKKPDELRLNETVNHYERKVNSQKQLEVKLNEELRVIEKSIASREKMLSNVKKAFSDFEANAQTVAIVDITLSDDQLLEYQNLRAKTDAKLMKEKNEMKLLSEEREAKSYVNPSNEFSMAEAQLKELESEMSVFGDRKKRIAIFIDTTTGKRNEAKKVLDDEKVKRMKQEQTESELEEKLSKIYASLAQVKYDKKESERRRKFMSAVETLKRLYSGVHGCVSNLCKPRQSDFDNAISRVLGKNIDAIVVEDEHTAINCIEFFKEQQIGVGTFLPLDSLQCKPINEKFRGLDRGAWLAIDLIQFDEAFRPVLEYACGNTIVCDTLQTARSICYDRKQNVKAVTKDGTVIHKSGMITGGTSLDDASGSMWEEKQIMHLQKLKDTYESELLNIQRDKQRGWSDEDRQTDIGIFDSQLANATEDLKVVVMKINSLDCEIKEMLKKIKLLEAQSNQFKNEFDAIDNRIESLELQIAQYEAKIFAKFCAEIGIQDIQEYEGVALKQQEENAKKHVSFASQISRIENEYASYCSENSLI
eukprot:Partr_v1_DN28788_c0_g1_i3_m62740 putative structural maintenance of chromosomes protein